MDVYKSVSRQIHEIFHDYTDIIEPLSLDEAFWMSLIINEALSRCRYRQGDQETDLG